VQILRTEIDTVQELILERVTMSKVSERETELEDNTVAAAADNSNGSRN
jgi:hypothetical protein